MIEMSNVIKRFKVYRSLNNSERKIRSLFIREFDEKCAVEDLSFTIEQGEIVGYVGPNGAGKSTTIKLLTGVLVPTSGVVKVDGIIPYKQRRQNAMNIGVVFGQRSQLYWDLPMMDTFRLHQKMYEIEESVYKQNVGLYTEVLQMKDFLSKPVRQLSLGQKMRANFALALLHDPHIVYLDEPTIGLDIVAKSRIREFITEINRIKKTTFILTTHDMSDIECTCERLMLINHGRLAYDGDLRNFQNEYGDRYRLHINIVNDKRIVIDGLEVQYNGEGNYILSGSRRVIPVAQAISQLTNNYSVRDIRIEESNIEGILQDLYRK